MSLFSPNNLEHTASNLVREAFVLLALKLIVIQLFIGTIYFLLIDQLGLISAALDLERLLVFGVLQGAQIILSLYFFLRWFNHCYDITDKEVVCYEGIFIRKSDYYSLERLESANLKQGIWGLIFGYGTIKINIHHSDHRDSIFIRNIKHPRRHMKALEKTLRDHSNMSR